MHCKLLNQVVEIIDVNVGNAAPIPGAVDYKMVTKSIAVTKEEAAVYRKIAELRGGVLTSRLTTMNETEDFLDLLNKSGL
jgi:mannose/fructose/N-acetylgalactosamine-specific phosphotransferase system component IIB